MKRRIKFIIYLVFFSGFFVSCQDVLEDDLTGKKISIIAPVDSSRLYTGDVLFYWDYIDINANYHESYNLLVVSPKFNNIQKYFLDTAITLNKFQFNLAPGEYQCSVYASNGSTYSDTSIVTFTVMDTTNIEDDLSGKSINVNFPTNNSSLFSGNTLFWWDYVNDNTGNNYNLVIVTPSFNGIQKVILDTTTSLNKIEYNLSKGDYQFWVYAFNGASFSDTIVNTFNILDTIGIKNQIQ